MMQYVAYEGNEFTIEWFCNEKGISQALEHFLTQPKDKQRKALNLFRLIGEHGKIHDETKFRNEQDRALRARESYEMRIAEGTYYEKEE